MASENSQGEVYFAFVNDLLDKEYERRNTIEARGASIVTASASLLTVIFGVSVLFTGKDYKFHSHLAVQILYISLGLFVLAALLAIWVQTAQVTDERISEGSLHKMLDEHWTDDEVEARNACANIVVYVIGSLRRGTLLKARVPVAPLTVVSHLVACY